MTQKLYVGNLPFSTTQADIQEMFSRAGDIISIYLSTSRYTVKSSGFAFVEMATESDTQRAIEMFHGYLLADRPMTVQAIENTNLEKGKGAANTVIYRKLPRPSKEEQNGDEPK